MTAMYRYDHERAGVTPEQLSAALALVGGTPWCSWEGRVNWRAAIHVALARWVVVRAAGYGDSHQYVRWHPGGFWLIDSYSLRQLQGLE
jgi:hypothetical protein